MHIERAQIPDVLIITPKKHGDHRGFFSETFRNGDLQNFGIDLDWIQDNHSFSTQAGVVRGLHWQTAPHAQAKLVRVVRGAILDVAVDIRKGSPTYGAHVAVELSGDNWRQLLVPVGFAHGFCALTDECEVLYKVTAPYAPECEGGLLWDDPALGIDWRVKRDAAILSGRDRAWPGIGAFDSPFNYETAGKADSA
jgi:dTDP-4-dehydrorhamnose 3,5-epimerase